MNICLTWPEEPLVPHVRMHMSYQKLQVQNNHLSLIQCTLHHTDLQEETKHCCGAPGPDNLLSYKVSSYHNLQTHGACWHYRHTYIPKRILRPLGNSNYYVWNDLHHTCLRTLINHSWKYFPHQLEIFSTSIPSHYSPWNAMTFYFLSLVHHKIAEYGVPCTEPISLSHI